ncbi:MAG: hypothetical protein CSA58_10285 [Micrococcales bacterium]|nr:MAG: hypothetical protein CSA58_10285 [Micrococcales bacterium]
MINARMEKAAHSSAFRKPLAARRCLVPADGWFEWRVTGRPGKYGKPGKQPYFMIRADAVPLAFAGLYEFWRDPRVADKNDPAAWWVTYTILTRPAEPGPLAQVHDRMPLVLDPSAWPDWLDPTLDQAAEGAAMMRTAAAVDAGRFRAVPVSPAVGNVANRGPELVAPIDISGQPELALDWPV